MARVFEPVTPGEVLKEEFMGPYGLSARGVGDRIGVPGNRISRIISGNTEITIDTAYRLAKLFGTSVDFWLNLQANYNREMAEWGMQRREGIYAQMVAAVDQIETLDPAEAA